MTGIVPNRLRPRPSINFCRTPEGLPGECSDVRKCMWLMFNVEKLRQSVCLRNLVVPGVCCPSAGVSLPNPPVTQTLTTTIIAGSPSTSSQQSVIPPQPPSALNKKPILTQTPAHQQPAGKPLKVSIPVSIPSQRPIFHSSTSSPTTTTTSVPVTKRPVHSWIQEVPVTGHSLGGSVTHITDGSNHLNQTSIESRGNSA